MRKKGNSKKRFAVCVNNEGYPASLEVGKLYLIVPNEEASSHGYICIIDESGEEYAYSSDRFFPIEVPAPLEKALLV